MASSSEQYGIDALFTSDVPDYLKCVACQLVLRNPLQFLDCGHKICMPCFERLKQYTDGSCSLHCPLDREEVDLQKVVPDNGAKRIVGNLPVRCGNESEGCKWNGDLRNLDQHQQQCVFRKQKAEAEEKDLGKDDALLKALIHRISSCENALQEKDKDITSLKYRLTEVSNTLDEKLGQLDVLKSENEVMKMQMKDVAKIEMKLENLNLKHVVLEQKLDMQGNDLLALTKELQEKDETISTLRNSIAALTCEGSDGHNEEDNYDESVSDADYDDRIEDRLDILESHISNLENTLYCKYDTDPNEIKFEWVLQDYQQHFEKGVEVMSPNFLPSLMVMCFPLVLSGQERRKVSLGYISIFIGPVMTTAQFWIHLM